MPRTRQSNQDADFKVYYSKKVPKQAHFPPRAKKVRREPRADDDAPEPRQSRLNISDKEKGEKLISNANNKEDEEMEAVQKGQQQGEAEEAEPPRRKTADSKRGKKRNSDLLRDIESGDDEEPVRSATKRRRRVPAKELTPALIKVEAGDEELIASSSSESEAEPQTLSERQRRQSTMTQIASGRKPLAGDMEPEFKPAKKLKAKANKRRDKAQQTLTQMIPSMFSGGIVSDEDEDEEFGGLDQDQGDSIPVRHDPEPDEDLDEDGNNSHSTNYAAQQNTLQRSGLAASDEDEGDYEDEDYKPTQYIHAPVRRTHSSRRVSEKATSAPAAAPEEPPTARNVGKSRFSLLSTPQRRRIVEIPSSQSPAESLLSTQTTPLKSTRKPLREREANAGRADDTPSKRKQVTFQEPNEEQRLPKRRLPSVIQDSEDEDSDVLDEDDENETPRAVDPGTVTQAMIRSIEHPAQGKNVGAETQAQLQGIDQACANAKEDEAWMNQGLSEEDGEPLLMSENHEASPELGEPNFGNIALNEPNDEEEPTPRPRPIKSFQIKQETGSVDEHLFELSMPSGSGPILSADDIYQDPLPSEPPVRDMHGGGDDFGLPSSHPLSRTPLKELEVQAEPLSTPVVIKDESSPTEQDLPSSPSPNQPRLRSSQFRTQQSERDLDGEPIQVPRSPSTNQETQQTDMSHSSKAEAQLQSEYKSYSQYRQAPPSSSMFATADKSSYQATPVYETRRGKLPQYSSHLSQATTIDCSQASPKTTPRKPGVQTQPITSTHTTPRHIVPSSQLLTSPEQPPTLVIPSSLPPTPSKWSSPARRAESGRTGPGESLNVADFSIPPMPPSDDWDDQE